MKVTFEEPRARLAIETRCRWFERAIARTAPALFGWFSVAVPAADVLIEPRGGIFSRTTAWHARTNPTFAGAIALVRRHIRTQQETFATSEPAPELIKLPRKPYRRMPDTLANAACLYKVAAPSQPAEKSSQEAFLILVYQLIPLCFGWLEVRRMGFATSNGTPTARASIPELHRGSTLAFTPLW